MNQQRLASTSSDSSPVRGSWATPCFPSTCWRLEPCPLCIFQRVGVISLGVVFLVAALRNPEVGSGTSMWR